ncbi:hypothetical protein AVL59_17085 [Streptomyces griseochromogenes]|uniref:Uncharacterized protein n=1 Tax=Streptomyces griseochromogenes TaxID=68214 RepID=A0A1B1AX44_9ACTN|nr:hypothetical protein AVL59_17085 [Streptomyces griseochromogenes]
MVDGVALLDLIQRHFQQVAPVADHSAYEGHTRYPGALTLMCPRRCGLRLCLLTLPLSFSARCLLHL